MLTSGLFLLVSFAGFSLGLKCMQPSDARYIQPSVPFPNDWLNPGLNSGQYLSRYREHHHDQTHSRGVKFGRNGTRIWWLQNHDTRAYYLLTADMTQFLCAQQEGGLEVDWFPYNEENRVERWCQWLIETNPTDPNLFKMKNFVFTDVVDSVQHIYWDRTGVYFDYDENARNDARNRVPEQQKWFRWGKAEPSQRNMTDIEEHCVIGESGLPDFLETSEVISARGATRRRSSLFYTSDRFAQCYQGWFLHAGKCYRLFQYIIVNQARAKKICGFFLGKLIVPKNVAEQRYIKRFIGRYDRRGIYWLGTQAKPTGRRFYDTDGNRLKFTRWEKSQTAMPWDKCSYFKQGKWFRASCQQKNKVLCVKESIVDSSTQCGKIKLKPLDDAMSREARPSRRSGRVVNGIPAEEGQFPWQASIRFKTPVRQNGLDIVHNCGGTLIDNCWVLTAAHCVNDWKDSANELLVRVGDLNNRIHESSEQEFDIQRIIVHEEYSLVPAPRNDIALLKLAARGGKCASFNDFVQPACLPDEDFPFPDGSRCQVSGWGATNYTQGQRSASANLLWATLPKLKHRYCESRYAKYPGVYTEGIMFCAGLKSGGTDACTGDSGGPYVCRNEQGKYSVTGIVSFGIGCARRQYPGVYTNVTMFIPWIGAKINANGGGVMIRTD